VVRGKKPLKMEGETKKQFNAGKAGKVRGTSSNVSLDWGEGEKPRMGHVRGRASPSSTSRIKGHD